MKAKYYIGILSALLLAGMPVKAQDSDDVYLDNDDAPVVTNIYNDNYDYYYSSRINRFHRSYSAFDYYSPIYTDTYWYTYNPFSWGISIYRGGLGFSLGYNFNYPLYNINNNCIDLGWYNPYYSSSYYWAYDLYYYNSYYWSYDPYIYNYWYSPVYYNWGYRDRWARNSWGWNRHNFRNGYYAWNDYRPGYSSGYNNNYRDNPSTRYSSRDNNLNYKSRRTSPDMNNQSAVNRSMSQPWGRSSSMGSQPESRRNYSQSPSRSLGINQSAYRNNAPQYRNHERSMSAPSQSSSPSRREGMMSQSRGGSSQPRPRSSSASPSRSNDNGGRRR